MKTNHRAVLQCLTLFSALLLASCGGGGGGGAASPAPNPRSQMGGAIQGSPLSLTAAVSTFAGTATGADGTGAAARFGYPEGLVSDGTYLYVADRRVNTIRKIVISTGVVTTLAGSGAYGSADGTGTAASFAGPLGLATDGANLYVADFGSNKIRKIVIATGVVSSLTGTPNMGGAPGAADGTATVATFNQPAGITIDSTHTNLYVSDANNNKIRKVVISTGAVSSFTGVPNTVGAAGAEDGAAAAATFNRPLGLNTDGTNLYVVDTNNNKIRKIVIVTGVVSSFTGAANTPSAYGAADGTDTAATFGLPWSITTDGTNLYVADANNNKIRKIVIATGAVSSFTGETNVRGATGSADGAGTAATFNAPLGITTDGTYLYVGDTNNATVRQIAIASGMVSTLAGTVPGTDGTGAAASFSTPGEVTTDGTNLYVADSGSNKIRRIVISTGVVTTLAGTGAPGAADGPGLSATFSDPIGITTDGTNLYVTDAYNYKIRKIVIATGVVSSFTGVADTASPAGAADGAGPGATFGGAGGITTDGTNLYVIDPNNYKIRKVVIATGVVSSLTGAANTASAPGAADGAGPGATFGGLGGITTDGTNLFMADGNNDKIRKIVIATGVVSSFTGVANTAGSQAVLDGAASTATFAEPLGITCDGTNLYVSDAYNNKIRKIVIATGVVSSLTGVASEQSASGAADGAGATATFNQPSGITTDGTRLYVVDTFNSTIRKIQ